MTKNHPDISCHCLQRADEHCFLREEACPVNARPLSETCCHGRVKVCRVSGDRKNCARMANLGLIPGTEMELLCPHQGRRQCMVKLNGGTISLDSTAAASIFVTAV